jgi:hypothetical protein
MIVTLAACSDEEEKEEDLKDYLQKEDVVDNVKIGDSVYHFDNIDSETVTITDYVGVDTPHHVEITAELNGKTVVGISDSAFYYHSNIKSVKIPDTVKTIGKYAFAGCSMLETVTIPAGVETMGDGAFYGCTALLVLNFAEGSKLADIPKQAFSDCTALVAVNIPSTVKTDGTAAFLGCSALARVKAAEGVEVIGSQAFQNCTALKQVILPASIVSIGSLAFSGSENLYVEGVSCPENSVAAAFFASMKLENKPAA